MRSLFHLNELLGQSVVQVAISIAVLLLLVSGAYFLIRYLQAEAKEGETPSSEMLTNFRELHEKGQLSDREYRNIKQRLSENLHSEVKSDEHTG